MVFCPGRLCHKVPGWPRPHPASRLFTAGASVGGFLASVFPFLPALLAHRHLYECVYIIYTIAISILDILLRFGTSIKLRSNSQPPPAICGPRPTSLAQRPIRTVDAWITGSPLASCFFFFHDQGVKTRRDKLYINVLLPAGVTSSLLRIYKASAFRVYCQLHSSINPALTLPASPGEAASVNTC